MDKERDRISNRIGGILRDLREGQCLTREQLAEMADVGHRHLAAIELREKSLGIDTLYRLVRALNVSSDHFFNPDKVTKDPEREQIDMMLNQCTPNSFG